MIDKNIKNVVFDFGNVLIDLDIERTWSSLRHYLGDDGLERLAMIYPSGDLFIDFEVGKISEDFFFKTLSDLSERPLSIRALKEAWNAMLLGIKPERFDMLLRLRKKYRVFLLSNTNKTHIDFVDGYLQTVYNFPISVFETRYFEKVYYSHVLHLRKPNRNIYDFVCRDADINPSETLFFDDNVDNIEAATLAGWHVHLHILGNEITTVLQDDV